MLAWRLDKEDREEAEKRRREDADGKVRALAKWAARQCLARQISALERELEAAKARLLQARW